VNYQVQLVWNREFEFVTVGRVYEDIPAAIAHAEKLQNMGDGERVKKTRVVDQNQRVVWQHGRMVDK